LAGLAAANIGLETGAKALEAGADSEFTPEEQSRVRREGLTKGAVITGVDAATLGITNFITGTTRRAVERATIKTLADHGVDVASDVARRAAMKTPAIATAVKTAQELAEEGAKKLGTRLAQSGGAVALETVGEGAGEYLGELAATGKADAIEAVIEGFAGLGTSIGEISATSALNRKGLKRLFDSQEEAQKTAETETKETGVEHEVIPHPAEPEKFVAVPKVRSIAGIELERDATGNLKPKAPVSTQADFNLANRSAFELTAEDKLRQREIERQREEELAKNPIITPTIAGKPVTELPIEALNYTVSRGSTRSREIAAKELERRQNEGDTSIPEKPSDTVKRIVTTGDEKAQEDAKKAAAAITTPEAVKPATAPKTANPVTAESREQEKAKSPGATPATKAKTAPSKLIETEKMEAEKTTGSSAQKEPWQMTANEWNKAVDNIRPETVQSRVTKASASEAIFRAKEGERLRYGVTAEASKRMTEAQKGTINLSKEELDALDDRLQTRVSHKDVIEKALKEGRPVPEEVLSEYPDLAAKQTRATPAAPADAIRPHIESLIKRRAAASQTGKERSVNNAINRAKEVMDGKRTDTALESKWFRVQAAAMRKVDPETAEVLSRIGDTIKSTKQSPNNAGVTDSGKEDQQQVVPKSKTDSQKKPDNAEAPASTVSVVS
jgi:hypothetical protein